MTLEQVKNEIITYFKNNIIGTKNTLVEKINDEFTITNRGHGIAFTMKDSNCGPLFYAEEILSDMKTKSISTIANEINNTINHLKNMREIAKNQIKADPDENIIFTATATKTFPEKYRLDDIEYEKYENFGIIIFIKTLLKNSPIKNAYTHIRKLNENDDKNTIYNKAINNTLKQANIRITAYGTDDNSIPPMLIATDTHQFADYFYIISNSLIDDIARRHHFKQIYILPTAPYEASMIAIPDSMDYNDINAFKEDVINTIISKYYESNPIMPCIMYDRKTKKFSVTKN